MSTSMACPNCNNPLPLHNGCCCNCPCGWEFDPADDAGSQETPLDERYETLRKQNAALLEALSGLLDIASESSGVAGYHLNGEIAYWDEFPEHMYAHTVLDMAKGLAPVSAPDNDGQQGASSESAAG